ncbi:MAG TPA: DUF2461 domain-containing protein [Tepidisphaeraceae bacterium]|jgi:uncharacterized protein (TIGR02453 family)
MKQITATRSARFGGFSRKVPAFFRGLEKNNNREWFTPRKEFFESEIRAPMVELVTLVNEDLKTFALANAVAVPAKAIYRIYRDTRFSKDKTPYKTHIGAIFPRQGLPKHGGAGYYFGVSHKGLVVAGGMYGPGPEELTAMRQAIAEEPGRLEKLASDRRLTKALGKLQGDRLARVPKGFEKYADTAAGPWLKHKQLYWYVELPVAVALSSGIRKAVVDRFRRMAEALEWMNGAILSRVTKDGQEERPVRPAPMW